MIGRASVGAREVALSLLVESVKVNRRGSSMWR